MKIIFLSMLLLLSNSLFSQSYDTKKQGGNNNSGGNYVAPVVTKTYTMPSSSPSPSTPTYNSPSSKSSSPSYTPSNNSSPSKKVSSEPGKKVLSIEEINKNRAAALLALPLFCSSCLPTETDWFS